MLGEGCFVRGCMIFFALFLLWAFIGLCKVLFGYLAPALFAIAGMVVMTALGVMSVILMIFVLVAGIGLVLERREDGQGQDR